MKLSLSIIALSSLFTASNARLTPYHISLNALQTSSPIEEDSSLIEALSTSGMITVGGLSRSFKDAMKTLTATQHECLMESKNTQEQTYPDGTVRTTLATHTVAGVGGKQALKHQTFNFDACDRFEAATNVIRAATQEVVGAFSSKMTSLFHNTDGPILVTESNDYETPFAFKTFTDVVENGEHLEHFHSYTKTSNDEDITIELHTDQGLFLVFTPGRLSNGELTNGFYVQTIEGATEEVQFSTEDDLVLMLGDGVNQYINKKIESSNVALRAVPHVVKLESSEYARIWYGLMVLPPSSAIHPLYGDVTFGQLRQGLLSGDKNSIQLACSNSGSTSNYRMLEEVNTTCANAEEVYCWHRCMNSTEFDVSEDICASMSLELECINPRNQISLGISHGDFYPGCAGSDWENETAFPALPNFPRDDALCTDFASFYDDGEYANSVALEDGVGALFQYNITSDGIVKGRLAFNGIFGYLSFGFAGVGGHLSMFNAPIILAMRGGDFTPLDGLNLTLGPEVKEYITSLNYTAFRHWSTPYGEEEHDDGEDHDDHESTNETTATERSAGGRSLHGNESHYWVDTEKDDCYTSLYFEVKSIAGANINLMGKDTFIWAANRNDTFMGYHGKDRGNFTIDWKESVTESDEKKTSGTSGATSVFVGKMIGGIVSVMTALVMSA